MEKKSYDEIIEILKQKLDEVDSFAHEDYDEEELGLGPIKQVDSHGGEDEGSNWYVVKHFVEHDVYIKVSGYYQSHHGTDFWDGWDSCKQVSPQSKTITVYE